MKAGQTPKMKQGRQTSQRKAGSIISPGRGQARKWTSYLRAFFKKHLSSARVHPRGKGPRGRRSRA